MNSKIDQTETQQCTQQCWMVVDDNTDILSLTRAILERITDAPVECFHSPEAALAAFQGAPRKYGLVITDFEMPGINGAELCRRLRSMAPALKVLLITGSGIIRRSAVAEMGFSGLLHKPFVVSDLEKALTDAGVVENQALHDLTKEFNGLMMA
jgi:CheY-like chemotaxis protein